MTSEVCDCRNPIPDQSKVDEWIESFRESIWSAHMAIHGATMFADQYVKMLRGATGSDRLHLKLTGTGKKPSTVVSSWTNDKIKSCEVHSGPIRVWATQAWIIEQFARWEDDGWRAKIAKAGCTECHRPFRTKVKGDDWPGDVRSNVMGDLRALRNAIVHRSGVYNQQNIYQFRVLKKPNRGEQISLSDDDFIALHNKIGCHIEHEPSSRSGKTKRPSQR